ncbi:MAG: hypothetical protein J6M44_09515 [Butyrivibrio sp.]|nr:hypothetical protein [Butyrivibrio sp.]
MTGPLDRLFGNTPFDLNHDGKIDAGETAFLYDTFYEDNNGISSKGRSFAEDDDELDDIELAGLDRDELEFMDEDERREALEDAGLDPDDLCDDF